MRKVYILLAFIGILFYSCTKDRDNKSQKNTISFETSTGIQIDANTEISLTTNKEFNKTDSLVVYLNFAGSAKMGVDYTVSSDSLVLGGKHPINKVVITPLILGSNKLVEVSMKLPKDYQLGRIKKMYIRLSDKLGYVSFAKPEYFLTSGITSVVVNLLDGNGNFLRVNKKLKLDFKIYHEEGEKEAVEGVDYEIVNKDDVYFMPGQYSLSINIKPLNHNMNTFSLILPDQPLFKIGDYYRTYIHILDLSALLNGKWFVKSIDPSAQDYANAWGFDMSQMKGYPAVDSTDYCVINTKENTFSPHFKSALKNYFIGESGFTFFGKVKTPVGIKLQPMNTYQLNNVNRYFSDTEFSKDKNGLVGVSLVEDKIQLRIFDFESHSFAKDLLDYDMYSKTPPAANTGGVFFDIILEKAKN